MNDEFSFVENKEWLQEFLISLKSSYGNNVTFNDAIEYAISNIDILFRNNCLNFGSYDPHEWLICTSEIHKKSRLCRISNGFNNKHVPSSRKFNPLFHEPQYENELKLAYHSYEYLTYHNDIKIMLTTPMSDYTRYSNDNSINRLDRIFIMCLRYNDINSKNRTNHHTYNILPISSILNAYEKYSAEIVNNIE